MAVKRENNGTWTYYGTLPVHLQSEGNKYYKKRGFKTKKEAKDACDAFVKSLSEKPTITYVLEDLIREYNIDAPTVYKESTLSGYKHIENDILIPAFGGRKIDSITTIEIQRWINDLYRNGNNGNSYSPETCKSFLLHLSGLFSYAVKRDWIVKNPCKGVNKPKDPNKVTKDNAVENFWTQDEFDYFIETIKDDNKRTLFEFTFYGGFRIGEVAALQWKHINFENYTVTIEQALSGVTAKITTPKTANSYRTITMPAKIIDKLKIKHDYLVTRIDFNENWYVFGDATYTSDSTIRRWFKDSLRDIDIKPISFHGLRHSAASKFLADPTIPEQLIADRLGHTVAVLRKTYAHVYENRKDEFDKYVIEL